MAILKAVDYLKENLFAGEMYDGELLEKLSCMEIDSLTNCIEEIKNILSNAIEKNNEYEWLDDEERIKFAEIVIAFRDKIGQIYEG